MALDLDQLLQTMKTAGEGLAGGIWNQLKTFALPELKKIAIQIVAIEVHKEEYTEAGAKALMQMQRNATIGVLVAMTTLTLLEVQAALNAILEAVQDVVNGALNFPLI